MESNLLYKPVKDDGITKEAFLEHAIKTYHVGNFLYGKLKPNIDNKKYLFSCFFHDVGKLLIKLGKEAHTPKSKEGLDLLKTLKEYPVLLEIFELEDYSSDKDVLHAIEKHHNSDNELSAFTAIADQISSSTTNDDLKNKLKESPISAMITYLNEKFDFDKYNFYYLSIPSFSKNELNTIGKLLLLKLLYETIDKLDSTQILYETLDGCRIVTELNAKDIREIVIDNFNKNFVEFIKNQKFDELIGGAPDGFKQYTTFPKELKPELIRLTTEKYQKDILNALKKEKIKSLEDIGLSNDALLKFAYLDDLKNYYSNISGTKYSLLADQDGNYAEWVVDTFFDKSKFKKNIVKDTKPVIEQLLQNVGINTLQITNKKIVYNKLIPLVMAVNSVNSSDIEFSFDISKFLAIDGSISKENIAKSIVCANCGTFEGKLPLETFTFGHRQHYRESLFRERNDKIRQGKILVCELCHSEALLNTILCGISIENQRARVNVKTHLVLYGINIDKNLINDLGIKDFVEKLLKDFKITEESIYVKTQKDLQIILLSLAEYNSGIKNDIYRLFLFSLLAYRIKERNPLITSFSINSMPKSLNNEIIQSNDGDFYINYGKALDYFEYVYCFVNTKNERKRDYILEYYNNPFIGIAQIFRRENVFYDEQTEKVVGKLSENDMFYEITNQIWEMAMIGGALETGKNVGSFVGIFKGTVEDFDKITNKLLKNEKLSTDQRQKIIDIHQDVRERLKKINEDERKELKDYVQKTKYLFNSKKFYEIKKAKEEFQ